MYLVPRKIGHIVSLDKRERQPNLRLRLLWEMYLANLAMLSGIHLPSGFQSE